MSRRRTMRRGRGRAGFAAFCAALLAAAPAAAEGFAVKDLQTLSVVTEGYAGGAFTAGSNEPERLTIFCASCDPFTAIDIQLGRSTDGTEERYRRGETTIEQMEALCQARSPTCTLEAAQSGEAVGWITRYPLGGTFGSTVVLFLDGDRMTIRSLAGSQDLAEANARYALATVAPAIIDGPE